MAGTCKAPAGPIATRAEPFGLEVTLTRWGFCSAGVLRPGRHVVDALNGPPVLHPALLRGADMSKVSVETALSGSTAECVVDRRQSQRGELIVRVDYATVDELFSEFTRDVNEGGLFIETDKPRPSGTEVSLHFNLPGRDRTVETHGIVVRVSDGSDGSTPGMGIQFGDLPPDARQHINQLIRALRSRAS